jgi:hypothetical protein
MSDGGIPGENVILEWDSADDFAQYNAVAILNRPFGKRTAEWIFTV